MSFAILQFSPNDRERNLALLLQSENLKGLEETSSRIHEFFVQTDRWDKGASSGVDPFDGETRELLLLVLYLYRFSRAAQRKFQMKKHLVDIVIAYYGRDKCLQALGNQNSRMGDLLRYPLLARLLNQEAVVVITTA